MKKLLLHLLTLIALAVHTPGQSQTHMLTGRVEDTANGEPIPFATVSVRETGQGVISNAKGEFTIALPANRQVTVIASHTGYQRQELMVITPIPAGGIVLQLQESVLNLDEVVVTATRTPRTLKEVPILTQVITAQEIQRVDAVSLRELLEVELPGLEFTRMGGYPSINLQGMGGNYVLFLVDGERMTGETRNNIDYNRLNLDNIERIEIVKGAASTLYGSNAVGGVVNIITRKAYKPLQLNVNAHMGGVGEQSYALTGGTRQGGFSSTTALSFRQSRSYSLQNTGFLEKQFENGGTLSDSVLRTTHVDGSRNRTIDQRFTYTLPQGIALELKGGYFDNERFNSGIEGTKLRDYYQDYHATARAVWQIQGNQSLAASYRYDNYSKHDYFLRLNRKDENYRSELHNPTVIHSASIGRHELTSGMEYLHEGLRSFMFIDTATKRAYSYIAFVQNDFRITPSLSVIGGLRYDHHSAYGGHLSPKFSAMLRSGSWVHRVGYAAGYKSPTLNELYTNWDHRGMFRLVGNPNLIPETSHNFNLSTEFTISSMSASVVGYYNRIDNRIATVWNTPQDTSFYRNYDDATVWGFDFNYAWAISPRWTYRLAYSYVRDVMESDGRNLSTTRPHSATMRLEYRFQLGQTRNSVTLGGRVLGGVDVYTFDSSANDYYRIAYPSYQNWRLSFSSAFRRGITLTATIDNLLDYQASVATFNSSVSPGRTYFIGVSWDIEDLLERK